MVWKPEVRQVPHPWGEKGVFFSLEEVAKAAAEGSIDPRIRTWAIERLDLARKAGRGVSTPHDRARVLLEAVQEKLWVPDPVGAEYVVKPHLLACDPDKPKEGQVCVRGDDCDSLEALLAASFSSVGIKTLVVGHGYGRERKISHVLCAAHLPKLRPSQPWHYADPSSKFPLGVCAPFTRERILSIPAVKVLCDDSVCISKQGADDEDFVSEGVFVGVGALPGFAGRVVWIADEMRREPTLLEQAALRLRW